MSWLTELYHRSASALEHQDARFALHQALFNQGGDLRIKTLEIEHDTAIGRQQLVVLTGRVDDLVGQLSERTEEFDAFRAEAFRRLAVLAE